MADPYESEPTRPEILATITKCMQSSKDWRKQALTDKWRRAEEIFACQDKAEYTGQTRPNRAHLFVPIVYNQVTELTQEVADAFDNPRPSVVAKDPTNPRHILGAKLAESLFYINLEAQDPGNGWFPFVFSAGHDANVRGMAGAKWSWDLGRDRLRFESIPLEDLFWDSRASLTRSPDWWLHRFYRSPSYVKARIEEGVWEGRDDAGRVVDFEELKSAATVETDDQRTDTVYMEEMDPFSDSEGKEDLLELWEYYDLEDGTWYKTLTVKGVLLLEERQINPDGANFNPLLVGYTMPRAHHFDGESIPDRAADLQLELNKNRNLDIDGRNRELDPKTIASRRAGINLEQFKDGSELVMANRVGADAIQEFRYTPTAQAMIPRDAITMRDIHQTTGRTPPVQGKAEGSVRGSQGIGILTQNARAPLTRRIKCFWQTFVYPGLVKGIDLIALKETDETKILTAIQRAGIARELQAMAPRPPMTMTLAGQINEPPSQTPAVVDLAIQLLDEHNFYVRRDPDLRMIDPESYEQALMQMTQMVAQAQRTDLVVELLADLAISKGFPQVAAKLRQPMNPAMMPPQGPGRAAPNQPPVLPGMAPRA